MKKGYIFIGLFLTMIIGLGIYNPEVRIEVSQDKINESIESLLDEKSLFKVPVIKAEIDIEELAVELDNQKAYVGIKATGERDNGTKLYVHGLLTSNISYEEGKLYLVEPWIEEIFDHDLELQGKEKAVYDLYKKNQSLIEKITPHRSSNKPSKIKEKFQEYTSAAFEYVPIYNVNKTDDIKGWLIQQATGDVVIEDNQVVAILKPFSLLLKGVLISLFSLLFVGAAIKNPAIIKDLDIF